MIENFNTGEVIMVSERDKRIIELGFLTLDGLFIIEKSNEAYLKGKKNIIYTDKININGEKINGVARYSNPVLESAKHNVLIPFECLIKVQHLTRKEVIYFALQKKGTSVYSGIEYLKPISIYGERSSLLLESEVGSEIELGNKGKFVILRKMDFTPKKSGDWDAIKCKLYEKDSDFHKMINTIKLDIIEKNKEYLNKNLPFDYYSLVETPRLFYCGRY